MFGGNTEEQMKICWCTVIMVCLLIIAFSCLRVSNHICGGYSYMYGNNLLHAINSNRPLSFQSKPTSGYNQVSTFAGDGQHERPVFWNLGNVKAVADYEDRAVQKGADKEGALEMGTWASHSVPDKPSESSFTGDRRYTDDYLSDPTR
jgi:hypothetical protein